jgi:hypothetical protein
MTDDRIGFFQNDPEGEENLAPSPQAATGIRIDALDPTITPTSAHELASMAAGLTTKIRVDQILSTSSILGSAVPATSVIARIPGTAGAAAPLAATADGQVLVRKASALIFDKVTNAGLADMPINTVKGSIAGGPPVDLTAAQFAGVMSGSFVAKAGDLMTGALQLRSSAVPSPNPYMIVAGYLASPIHTFNGYVNQAGTGYVRDLAGYAGAMSYNAANGNTNWWNGGNGAAGAAYSLTNTMSLDNAGNLTAVGQIGCNTFQINTGGIYCNSGQNVTFYTGGVARGYFMGTGGGLQIPSGFTNTGLSIGLPSATVHGIVCTGYIGTFGILGYCTGQGIFGALGANLSGQSWSVYGSSSAYLGSGTWQASDATIKEIFEVDPFSEAGGAISVVEDIPVRSFKLKGPYRNAPNGEHDQFGWVAQEVEKVLPIAVCDVGISKDDLATRAFLLNMPMPERDSKEADELSEAEVPMLKAVNHQYLIATLWQAVQELSARVKALEGGVDAKQSAG